MNVKETLHYLHFILTKKQPDETPHTLPAGRRRHGDAALGNSATLAPLSLRHRQVETFGRVRPHPFHPDHQVFQAARGRSLSPPRRRTSSRWFWAERLAAWA